jgi:hypothetical protein
MSVKIILKKPPLEDRVDRLFVHLREDVDVTVDSLELLDALIVKVMQAGVKGEGPTDVVVVTGRGNEIQMDDAYRLRFERGFDIR